MSTYTPIQWLILFYIYCFIGWIWETCYVSAKSGHFVNRGFLRGPMLPIYGTGAIWLLGLTQPFSDHLFLTYLTGCVAATLLELVVGYGMERLFKVRYWDYSYQKYHFHGYICLSSTLAWGFFTLLLDHFIQPQVFLIVSHMDGVMSIVFVVIVTVIFSADVYVSAKAALNLAKMMEKLEDIRAELDHMQVQTALLRRELEDALSDNFGDVIEQMDAWKIAVMNLQEEVNEKAAENKQKLLLKLEEIRNIDRREKELTLSRKSLFSGFTIIQRYLLESNPTAQVSGYLERSFREIKEKFVK